MPDESQQPTVLEPQAITPEPTLLVDAQTAPISDPAVALPTTPLEAPAVESTPTEEVITPAQILTEGPTPEVIQPVAVETAPPPSVTTPPPAQPVINSDPSVVALRPQAQATRTNRIQKKLDKIMEFAREKKTVRNDDIEKLLHVSDSTAQRHLSVLVKQGKLRKLGNRGSTYYEII